MIHFAVAAFTTGRLLQRECPACGHIQVAPPSQAGRAVICERCDNDIPPRRRVA
jgi:ribosomal protein S27E